MGDRNQIRTGTQAEPELRSVRVDLQPSLTFVVEAGTAASRSRKSIASALRPRFGDHQFAWMKASTSRVRSGPTVSPTVVAAAAALTACGPVGDAAAPSHADASTLARVDAIFADHASPAGPGCSLGVIHGGSLVQATGYGSANLDYGSANAPNTIFRVGSVAKQFTAAAIALLAIRGELELDAPVQRYIPELPDYPHPPTVRNLVHHTSGVRDYLVLMSLGGNRNDDFYTDQEVLDAISRQQELNFTPGTEYLYSNSGYFLLGEIVARVSGHSLREFAEHNFFVPLGMTRTHFHDDHKEIVSDRATGYAPAADGFRVDVTTLDMVGDGGIFTSVEDWVAWDRNLGDGGVGGDGWLALMHTRGVLDSGDTIPYAFGLVHGEHAGLATVSHGGGFVGYRAGMSRYPEADYSFVALCNGSHINPMALIASTAEVYMADRISRAEEATGPEAQAGPEEEDAPLDPPSREIPNRTRFAGLFHSPELNATYRIREEGAAGLVLHAGRWDPVTLLAESEGMLADERGTTFRFSGLVGRRYQAMTVDAGRVKNLRFTRVER